MDRENEQRGKLFRRSYWDRTAELVPFMTRQLQEQILGAAERTRAWKHTIRSIRRGMKRPPLGIFRAVEPVDDIAKTFALAETLNRFEPRRPTMAESGDPRDLFEDIRRRHYQLASLLPHRAEKLALEGAQSQAADSLRTEVEATAGTLAAEISMFPSIEGAGTDSEDSERVELFGKSFDRLCNYLDAVLDRAGSRARGDGGLGDD